MSWRDKIAAVLAGKVGGPTPTGIHVYHSSPHDFDRFDLSKIGTGEGAQVYGHGIYAAENPAVSGQGGQYWQQFIRKHPPDEQSATKLLQQHGFDRAKAAEDAQKHIETMQRYIRDPANAQDALLPAYERGLPAYQRQLELLQSGAPVGPRTYEVNFKVKPEELLDWDKPLARQPAGPAAWDVAKKWLFGSPEKMTGEEAYRGIAAIEDKPRASDAFRAAGIPGIRYLDGSSRNIDGRLAAIQNTGDGYYVTGKGQFKTFDEAKAALGIQPPTHNYVAFDPSKLDIMAKYGVVGGVPLGAATMGGTVDQSSYGARQ